MSNIAYKIGVIFDAIFSWVWISGLMICLILCAWYLYAEIRLVESQTDMYNRSKIWIHSEDIPYDELEEFTEVENGSS